MIKPNTTRRAKGEEIRTELEPQHCDLVPTSPYSPSNLLSFLKFAEKLPSFVQLELRKKMKKLLSKKKLLKSASTENVLEKHANKPTIAWNLLESSQVVKEVKRMDCTHPKPAGHTRFVCISDTHNRTDRLEHPVPDGDVLIHAGDFTSCGTRDQVMHFNKFLSTLSHPYKVVIAGNHEVGFDLSSYDFLWSYFSSKKDEPEEIRRQLTNCIYLEDEEVDVLGFRIFGSPW